MSEPWSERWQPRHQILSRLAREYHVLWLTPAHEWRETADRLRDGPALSSPTSVPDSMLVYRPESWLPCVYRPRVVGDALFRARLRRARAALQARGCTRIVVSLWEPKHAPALDAVEHDASCFHVDDEYSYSDFVEGDDPEELAVMGRVDAVFIHSSHMYARKATHCKRALLTPNGVDFDALAAPRDAPSDLAGIPRPIIGYTGYVKRQLDWSLMLELAHSRPDWSFVFVGARSPHEDIGDALAALEALPNVHMLGARTTEELMRYPQHFDVCVLPYRVTDYTNSIDPLKLGEYMAAGRPAVGSAIAPILAVEDIVAVARGRDEWEAAITRALESSARSAEAVARRHAWARARAWEASVRTIADCIDETLGAREAAADHTAPEGSRRSTPLTD